MFDFVDMKYILSIYAISIFVMLISSVNKIKTLTQDLGTMNKE